MIATAFSGWITPKTFISIGQNLLACQKSRQRTLFSIKLIVRSSTKVLLNTGAVVEEGAVQWASWGLLYTRCVVFLLGVHVVLRMRSTPSASRGCVGLRPLAAA